MSHKVLGIGYPEGVGSSDRGIFETQKREDYEKKREGKELGNGMS